ncbi:lipopolysaccharide kinase InaA family protein [Coraliomargarita sinensis]|nr:lipopolysaccharide kinase InaA family protein [Coraliomargarita sinensis]
MPYVTRFARNADLLKKREIPSVQVEATYRIPEIKRHAVLYGMLKGETFRDSMTDLNGHASHRMFEKLGGFIADLHDKGILFRSLHLGNVLVLSDGELALIDISDLSFRWFGPLSIKQRIRNFRHMDRRDVDRSALSGEDGTYFINAYLDAARLRDSAKQTLHEKYEAIFSKYAVLK